MTAAQPLTDVSLVRRARTPLMAKSVLTKMGPVGWGICIALPGMVITGIGTPKVRPTVSH